MFLELHQVLPGPHSPRTIFIEATSIVAVVPNLNLVGCTLWLPSPWEDVQVQESADTVLDQIQLLRAASS